MMFIGVVKDISALPHDSTGKDATVYIEVDCFFETIELRVPPGRAKHFGVGQQVKIEVGK